MINFKLTTLSLALAAIAFGTNSFASAPGQDPWTDGTPPAGSTALTTSTLRLGAARTTPLVSLGYHALAMGNESLAIGSYAQTVDGAGNSVALGAFAYASTSGGVALGEHSIADRASRATNAVTFNGEVLDATSGPAWVSGYGAAAIGSATATRQLMGVAAGSADTDAVNVAQLRSLKAYSDTTFSTASNTIFGEGASNVITPAVTGDDGSITDATLAQNAVIMGNNAKILVNNGSAFGYNAQVKADAEGGVAIGANSVASNEGRTAPAYLKTDSTTGGAWQTDENHGLVSFGGSYEATVTADDGSQSTQTVNFNRQITGVAAGSEDNDAVNVAQLKEVNNQVQGLITGDTKVSTIQLTPVDENGQAVENAPTIGLRYQVASGPNAQADGDAVTPTSSQGRLIYNNLDAQNNVIGTETIATLSDGIKLSGGTTTGADGTTVDSVNVNLNQGISFLGDEYLQTTVTAGENGGAVVTVGASQALKDFLANSGVQPSDPSNPSNPGGGSTGGTWTPNAAQQAALNGTYANGLTAGEGNNAVSIAREKDADGRYIVDMGGNRVQNVGNPINDGDAANKAYVDSTSRSLRNKINDVDKDLRAGVAMAMAVGGLPQAYMPGKSIVGVSAGTYHGQGGFALGLSHATDNRQWVFKGAASVDTRGNFGGQLSAGYQF